MEGEGGVCFVSLTFLLLFRFSFVLGGRGGGGGVKGELGRRDVSEDWGKKQPCKGCQCSCQKTLHSCKIGLLK